MEEGLKKADEVLQQAVQGITDLINVPSLINLDFADVQTVMKDKGIAHIGIGHGKGENKAADAIKMAVESPLLETTIKGATDIILNVTGDVSLYDANEASTYIEELTGDDVNVIFGATENKDMQDSCTITVIATGLEQNAANSPFNKLNNIGSGFSVKPAATITKNPGTVPTRPFPGIQRPSELRSNVEEKSLDIPSFLKKGTTQQ